MRSDLLFPAVGLLLVVLGWPLAARRVRPNRWYGLRVPATFAEVHVWYEANAMTGRDMMALGTVLVLVALALPRVAGVTGNTYAIVCAGILGLGSLMLTLRGWRTANRLIRERRDAHAGPRAEPSGGAAKEP
jgi:uncharacterized membrane protein